MPVMHGGAGDQSEAYTCTSLTLASSRGTSSKSRMSAL
jgi:hypothetical protein